jgi:hypothetical protein
MAILRSGILGQVRGKVAGVVGAQWKDKNYVREYIKPANPDTDAQKVQRALFASCVNFARPLVGPVFNEFVDQFQKSMSGFNFFIKSNISLFTAEPSYESVKITSGKLAVPSLTSAICSEAAHTVALGWSTALGSNGAASDQIWAAIYNIDLNAWAFDGDGWRRDDASQGVTVSAEWVEDQVLACYLFAVQLSGTAVALVSDSSYMAETIVA